MNPNIPRDKVRWHPTVNYGLCIGDHVCVDFCPNDVFAWDEDQKHPVVQHPQHCALGCDSCAQLCPAEAITFPSKAELQAQLHELLRQARTAPV